jgi:nitrogen regulatory protein PII
LRQRWNSFDILIYQDDTSIGVLYHCFRPYVACIVQLYRIGISGDRKGRLGIGEDRNGNAAVLGGCPILAIVAVLNMFGRGDSLLFNLKGFHAMKMICAIIRPHRLEGVKKSLEKIGVVGLTITDVRGAGRQKGQVERYRNSEYSLDLISKMRLEVAVADSQCTEAVATIRDSAHTGEIGDGKIFIYPLDDAVRIRTGESGEDSL